MSFLKAYESLYGSCLVLYYSLICLLSIESCTRSSGQVMSEIEALKVNPLPSYVLAKYMGQASIVHAQEVAVVTLHVWCHLFMLSGLNSRFSKYQVSCTPFPLPIKPEFMSNYEVWMEL